MKDPAGGMTRRAFLKILSLSGLGILASENIARYVWKADSLALPSIKDVGYRREALFYENMDESTVRCTLCPHECMLKNGQRSFCRVREPHEGKLYSLVYDLVCALNVDPIEKKPIYHMLPGSKAFSIATAGCNLRCKFCQNWQISQSRPEDVRNRVLTPEAVVNRARQEHCKSIAYTYSEPIIFYEYMLDTAKLAVKQGIKNIMVTAGYINPEPLRFLSGYIDAANVDLKAFDDGYLKKVCGQRLDPLLKALKIMREEGIWVEITNLVIPTLNDNMQTIKDMCVWIRENLGADTPLHFSRFWPLYKLKDMAPTPVKTLEQARDLALSEGLNYVYIGNVRDKAANYTYCPACKKAVIKRAGYFIEETHIEDSMCAYCGYKIAGIWG